MAPLIDRCSLIGKGVGFFTAFFRDSERKPAVSSVLGTACTCCKLHLGSRNRVRERMKKSQRERERERIDGDGDGEIEVLHFTTTSTE